MKIKSLYSKLLIITLILMQMNGCVNFDEWENKKHEKRGFNDLGLPIAIFPDPVNRDGIIESNYCLESEVVLSLKDLSKLVLMEPLEADSLLSRENADKLLEDYSVIKGELINVHVSPCMVKAIDYYSQYVESSISCIYAYKLGNLKYLSEYCDKMKLNKSLYFEELSRLEKCMPYCQH